MLAACGVGLFWIGSPALFNEAVKTPNVIFLMLSGLAAGFLWAGHLLDKTFELIDTWRHTAMEWKRAFDLREEVLKDLLESLAKKTTTEENSTELEDGET